ncbi:MAG TPA: hypothetical protein VMV93_10540 [Chloroflexota bacterium]|nr:hypothetical protein [Chloroflexota bacterium]
MTPGLSVIFFDIQAAQRWDKFAWYCLSCYRPLFERESNTASGGWDEFLRTEAEAVAAFNADGGLRRCSDCGTEHPLAYTIYGEGEGEGAAETAARLVW